MLRVGAQNGLMVTNRCPMEGIIGHGLGTYWAIGGAARVRLLRGEGVRRADDGQLEGAGGRSFPPNVWRYTHRGEWGGGGRK